jgi:predicted methyltransferase
MNNFIPAWRTSVVCLSTVMAAACIQLDPVASERMATSAAAPSTIGSTDRLEPISPSSIPSSSNSPSAIDSAISHPARLQVDREQDQRRKAAEVLGFFGIRPGMVVLDLYSGGGYYTELLSIIVGPAGRVVAHNNTPYLMFAKDELAARYKDERLINVEQIVAENNQLELEAGAFDAIIMIKSYHDVYFVSEDMGWVEIDRPGLLREIFSALKPGGVLGIVDHAADPGTPPESGGTLHRIDPAVIKRDMETAGFLFSGAIDILRNPVDDRSQVVFAPAVQGQTDRVVLRFRKP